MFKHPFSRIDRYLHPGSEDLVHTFFHTETDARTVTAACTRGCRLRGLRQVVAVFFFEGASDFPVLPEETASAASRTVSVVTHAVDYDRFSCHRYNLLLFSYDGSAEPAEKKKPGHCR